MKKRILVSALIATLTSLLFSSCIFVPQNTIVGTWQVVNYHDIEYQNGKVISNNQTAPLDQTVIVFTRNGIMQMVQQGNGFAYSMTGAWRKKGNQLIITDNEHQMACSAIVNGNSLMMSYAVEQKVNGGTYRYVTEMAARKTR